MNGQPEVRFCVRPAAPGATHDEIHRKVRELDEAITETVTGGVGDYNHDRGCLEVWLFDREEALDRILEKTRFDREEEPAAHRLIEEHGFVILAEDEILG